MKLIYCFFISNLMFISSFAQSFTQSKTVEVNHFIFPEFTQGVLLMKSGEELITLLNYNSSTEEMIYVDNEKKLAISVESLANIDTIFIQNKKFVVVGTKFFEFINNPKFDLYIEHKCKVNAPGQTTAYDGISHSAAVKSYSSIDMSTELKLPAGYEIQPYNYYRIMKNGISQKFINMRQLEKIYFNKKDLFKTYVEQNDIAFNNEENIIRLIKYLESN